MAKSTDRCCDQYGIGDHDPVEHGTATNEPVSGSYVAVQVSAWTVWVYRRTDSNARAQGNPERRWTSVMPYAEDLDEKPRTWAELCQLGPVAYVGAFVDRRKEAA